MQYLIEHRQTVQQIAGTGLAFFSLFFLRRSISNAIFGYKNFDAFTIVPVRSSIDLKPLMNIPEKQIYVVIPNLSCIPTPSLFKKHMFYIDDINKQSTNEFSYKQPCENFMAESVHNGEKFQIYCDCSTYDPYISSPLLCNNHKLLKNIAGKQRLTMTSYGSIKYDSKTKQFIFYGQSFATSYNQLQWVWNSVLTSKFMHFLVQGIILGIGGSLLSHNFDHLIEQWSNIFERSKLAIQPFHKEKQSIN